MPLEFRKVVVDIHDPGPDEQPTLEAARALAERTGARLLLFHNLYHRRFLDEGGDEMVAEARELLMESRENRLREWVKELGEAGIEADCGIIWSEEGWLELTRFASRNEADLVIGVTRPHTRWERLTLSNEDWQLIRYSPVPLLLVKADRGRDYRRILAAIDPLHADDKPANLDHQILEAAHAMSVLFTLEVDVANVVTPVLSAAPTVAEPLLATDTMAQEAVVEAHHKRVQELLNEHDLEPANVSVVVGDPADELVSLVSEREHDLLVMGAVARSALGRLLIGNTAEKVLDAVDCDLLIIKPVGADTRYQTNGQS